MWLFLIPWCIFVVVEIFICSAMFQVADENLKYIIILGAQVRGTKITNSLEHRLAKSYDYLIRNPNTIAIVSGGQGNGESVTEASAMAGYLTEHGIGSDRIIQENTSTTTRENLVHSSRYIQDIAEPVGIVTNNFHIYRAMKIAKTLGYRKVQGIVATSNPVLFLNYMVREFFACVYYLFVKNNL